MLIGGLPDLMSALAYRKAAGVLADSSLMNSAMDFMEE